MRKNLIAAILVLGFAILPAVFQTTPTARVSNAEFLPLMAYGLSSYSVKTYADQALRMEVSYLDGDTPCMITDIFLSLFYNSVSIEYSVGGETIKAYASLDDSFYTFPNLLSTPTTMKVVKESDKIWNADWRKETPLFR